MVSDLAANVLRVFNQYKENIDDLYRRRPAGLRRPDVEFIARAHRDCDNKLKAYGQDSKHYGGAKSESKPPRTKSQLKCLKEMEEWVNSNAVRLNSIFENGKIKQVLTTDEFLMSGQRLPCIHVYKYMK